MEIHQHPHSSPAGGGVPRKKWTHYFWEFIMLFLAVFCGFLAENQLEHKIEKAREKQYIKSLLEDLAADTVDLKRRVTFCENSISKADSLILMLSSPGRDTMAGDIYYFFRLIHRSDVFSVNDRTIVQLRNAGGMRLVSIKTVSDSILSYYKVVDFIRFIYEEQTEFRRSLRPFFPKILDGIDYGKVIDDNNKVIRSKEFLKLRSTDPEVINPCIVILQNIKGINMGLKRNLTDLGEKAKLIRQYILNKYHLN